MRRQYVALLTVIAAIVSAFAAFILGASRILNRPKRVGETVIGRPYDRTEIDTDGAVRSIQGADVSLPDETLAEIWKPVNLDRLARTYWSFLSKCTLGLIRVEYGERERHVVFVRSPLRLLSFHAPEYEVDSDRGIVRWRIADGLLVAAPGRGADGYLEIDVRRLEPDRPGCSRLHVDVTVANFYPAIAHSISRFVYANTQSRIHVIVTHGFLRSLAKGKLAESSVGYFTAEEEQSAAESTEGVSEATTRDPVPERDKP